MCNIDTNTIYVHTLCLSTTVEPRNIGHIMGTSVLSKQQLTCRGLVQC